VAPKILTPAQKARKLELSQEMAKSVSRLKELATSVKEMKKALADKEGELKQEKNKYKELVIEIKPLGPKEAQV